MVMDLGFFGTCASYILRTLVSTLNTVVLVIYMLATSISSSRFLSTIIGLNIKKSSAAASGLSNACLCSEILSTVELCFPAYLHFLGILTHGWLCVNGIRELDWGNIQFCKEPFQEPFN
eukprot:m.311045 g.311045  ORF g.311045 m.311045 type:complete len:119 (-) comp16481_c0_seq18:1199-1555(-)